MANKTLLNQVEQWLQDEKDSYARETVNDGNAIFHYRVKHLGSGLYLGIINPMNRPDTLVIGTFIPTSKNFFEQMLMVDDSTYNRFLLDFKITLTNRTPHAEIQCVSNRIQSFVVTCPLYKDGLNKNLFFQGITDVVASSLIGNWKIQKFMDEIGPAAFQFHQKPH